MNDFMPGNFGAKPPKIETTRENLLKEDTWARFYSLGEWVKTIPQLLNTLWTSKNEEEVRDIPEKLCQAFLACQQRMVTEDEVDEDSAILLCEFLVEVIRFSWPILKSDALYKGKLFKALSTTANEIEIPTGEPWGGPPNPVRAISKAANFLDSLLANAKDDLELLQCCALASIRTGMVSSTDNQLMDKLVPYLTTVTDDATRACFVYAAAHLVKESFFVDEAKKNNFAEVCQGFLSLPDVSLTKLMAALVTAQKQTNQAPVEALHILADYALLSQDYETLFDTTPLGNVMHLSYIIPNFVSALPPTGPIFFTRLLQNLKTIHDRTDPTLPVAVATATNFGMKEPILPGMKVFDLQPTTVTFLTTLLALDKVWSNEHLLAYLGKRGVPKKEDLIAFLADNVNDGTKRFPKFAGIEQIPWEKLGHAYGEATDVPDCLRLLASVDPRKRKQGQHALYGNIYHQGTTYSATPYAVPYLIEMLECTLVQDKPHIVNYCVNLLASFTEGYFCNKNGFDVALEYPLDEAQNANNEAEQMEQGDHVHGDEEEEAEDGGNGDDYNGIKHKIEKHLVDGLPVFFNLLRDANEMLRGLAAFLLAFLPRVATQSVPKIKEQLLVEKESAAKGSLLLALGMLLPRVLSREECLQFFNDQWNLVKDSDDESVKFCVVASMARLYFGQKPPKFVLDELLVAVGNEESIIEYHGFDTPSTIAMGLITVLKADDALPHIIQEFKNTKKMFGVLAVLRSMLLIAFRFEMENKKPIQPATLKPEQLEVLQAIIDNGYNTIWTFGNASSMLREFSLPANKEQMVEFIEKAKANKDVMEM
jgi:hypothetical protein